MYKLLMHAFPGWYRHNSVHALYPFITVEGNREILDKRGTMGSLDFDFNGPSFVGPPQVVTSWKAVVDVLCDQERFEIPCERFSIP
ncbi:hypothetical protein IMZ48_19855 [Candidatus Bathyarchaeota archaeon]|nr:hypothetical protein [Candidatus Bathyarchaeota archaeon]